MAFGKKTLFSLLLGFDLLANILEFAHINFCYTTTLLAFCTCILLPGGLISLILRIKKISFWENLLIIVGLSIAFLEFGGLLLNILLPLISVKDPLAFQNILFGFDIYVLLLFLFAWIRTKQFVIQISGQSHPIVGTGPIKHAMPNQFVKPGRIDVGYNVLENVDTITSIQIPLLRHSRIEKVLYTLPLFFPVLAALGAIVLNNGGSDILTLILLGAIACYSLLLVLFRDKIASDLFPYAIFFIGMALLFTTSLRSSYISGHDIETEFFVFQLTNAHHMWSMAFFQDLYNSCLSITILPTVLTNLLGIQDVYIYKVIFQILFAIAPIIVFFILKKYTTPVLAFLSALFFMSFPTFFNDMPMLNRQEIGFIFFGLALYMMLLPTLPLGMRRILFIIFALSTIVSHYSTNFVLLALVTSVYVLTFIITRPFVKNTVAWLFSKSHIKIKNAFPHQAFLSLPLIVLLFLMTYFWNTFYTNSSTHASSVIIQVVNGLFVPSSNDAKSGDLSYSIFSSAKTDPNKQLQDYIQSIIQSVKASDTAKGESSQFYSKSITDKYPSYPIPQEQIPPSPLGNWLSSLQIPVFDIQAELRSLSASFMQIFIFIGLLAILFFKNKKPFDLQYLLLCFSSLSLLVLITILPALSVEYGILRMFQQLLFVLSLPIVLGLGSILFFAKEQKRVIFTAIIATFFFLNLTGFISHLTGDYYPQMTLDNAGSYYDAYYVHKSDVLAMTWLSKNNPTDKPVEADLSGGNKLLTYGDITALSEIFPPIIRKDSYVYLEVSSHIEVSIDKNVLTYNSPKPFLDDNKNLIYSNGKNDIYK
ncbi:DUF2206 domain-containing protein [Ktedonobacteria bacterium brp13]|nr:DUF2206 domain-containing protein [Ktedonobacteria bacterium brp13]